MPEPAAITSGFAEVVRTIIPVLILFGIINWDDAQIAAVMLAVSTSLTFVTILITRSQVVPKETANTQIMKAVSMPKNTTVEEVKDAVKEDEAKEARNT